MDEGAIERATVRLSTASAERAEPADVEAALDRARLQVESLAQAAAQLEATLPRQVGDAVREGVRAEALPVARHTAELRGLLNALIRRFERLESDLLAERHARVDDLGVLVDLVVSGWRSVDERLARIEQGLESQNRAVVYRMDERRGSAESG